MQDRYLVSTMTSLIQVSRHVSPDKLRMLLDANPASIHEVTNDRKTALQLAKDTATRSHPNFALIEAIEAALGKGKRSAARKASVQAAIVPARVSSADSAESKNGGAGKKRKARATSRAAKSKKKTPNKKRKQGDQVQAAGIEAMETPVAADLLLHFSRSNNAAIESTPEEASGFATQVAEV